MPEYTYCPICENKLNKRKLLNSKIDDLNGDFDYFNFCKNGINHFFSFVSQNNIVQNIILTLNHNITVRINFQKGTSTVFFQENFTNTQTLDIPKILPTDFPKLTKLREILHLYSIFL